MFIKACGGNACENVAVCGHLADVDVYLVGDSSPTGQRMCFCCTIKIPNKELEQVVPSHGGDETCIPIKE